MMLTFGVGVVEVTGSGSTLRDVLPPVVTVTSRGHVANPTTAVMTAAAATAATLTDVRDHTARLDSDRAAANAPSTSAEAATSSRSPENSSRIRWSTTSSI